MNTIEVSERSLTSRIGTILLAGWGAVTGVAPHVLHHVGPLAGAAFLAGAGGRALFALIATLISIPFLFRLRRRFHSWVAPLIALVLMSAAFALSTFVIGPAITGEDTRAPANNTTPDPHGH